MVLTELEFAQVQFPPHAEIARQAVERIAKRRRPVVLEPEVPDPRKAVAAEERAQQNQSGSPVAMSATKHSTAPQVPM